MKIPSIKRACRNILDKTPYVGQLRKTMRKYLTLHPPGHYYSPQHRKEDVADALKRERELFVFNNKDIPGIIINDKQQQELFDGIKSYYSDFHFPREKTAGFRYYYNNGFFGCMDAFFLFGLLRKLKPRKIVEIGSGFSSAVMLDTNQHFHNGNIQCCFIEPDPERLLLLLNEKDKNNNKIISEKVQDVDLHVFDSLKENDILFIDSSHVSKVGSDVNHLFFNVLPRLQKGVMVHFHDVFYPFEYPEEWLLKERAWNESYILRAFLQYNREFEISLFVSYIKDKNETWLRKHIPQLYEITNSIRSLKDGSSIWIKKT